MAEKDGEMPWEKEGVEFDADMAKTLILNLRTENESLKGRNKDLVAKQKGAGSTNSELKAENELLKIQMATGLDDRQVKRLVGDTFEEKMKDAEAFAEEFGFELHSFFDSEAETGTPPEGDGANGNEEEQEQTPQHGNNYRAPAQRQSGVPEPDFAEMAGELTSQL